jgi:hypothetical protein
MEIIIRLLLALDDGAIVIQLTRWSQEAKMRKLNLLSRLHRLVMSLLGVVIVLDLGIGVYHFTHQGLGSGTTEFILAGLLLTTVYFIFVLHTQHTAESMMAFRRYLRAILAIIALSASVVFYLSIYHLTHEGLRSGIIELSMTVLLAVSGYLISRYK